MAPMMPNTPHSHLVGPPVPASFDLRTRYRSWLSQAAPWEENGSLVAGERTRRGLATMGEEWGRTTHRAWQALQEAVLRTPERVWFWSDLHLWHANICRYAGRPFTDVDSMNQALLDRAVATVGAEDWLVFLGDLTFGSEDDTKAWLDLCPGRKVIILGNHDVDRSKPQWKRLWRRFEAVEECTNLELAAPVNTARWDQVRTLWLTHYPLWDSWVPESTLNLHGHIHQNTLPGRRVNLSVEQTGFGPMRLPDILSRPLIT